MKPKLGLRNRELMIACLIVGPVTLLPPRNGVSGQTMQFFPIRSAPLGSPVGTVGDPVTPTFNAALNCWEVKVPGGVEVDIDVQGGGWGNFAGNPILGQITATVESEGYSNGVGADLNPKGWPADPGQGAYQAERVCGVGGDGSPCVPPFDLTCDEFANGFCVPNPELIFRPFMNANPLCDFVTPTLNYVWSCLALNAFNTFDPDPSSFGTFGGLILEVPANAAGTYVIAVNPDSNSSFFNTENEFNFGTQFVAACITISQGACCMDINSDDNLDSCQANVLQTECATSGGLFLGHAVACTGVIGACCLDGDGDGLHDTCREMDGDCCDAQSGSFLGAGSSCSAEVGACCLDTDDDSFYDTCRVINQTCCDAQGGAFGAVGSRCSPIGGACCLDEGTCVETNVTCCESQGGFSAGVGSVCRGDANGNGTDDSCDEGFPAVSEWGLVVMVLLLLVGIKICFARSRPELRA